MGRRRWSGRRRSRDDGSFRDGGRFRSQRGQRSTSVPQSHTAVVVMEGNAGFLRAMKQPGILFARLVILIAMPALPRSYDQETPRHRQGTPAVDLQLTHGWPHAVPGECYEPRPPTLAHHPPIALVTITVVRLRLLVPSWIPDVRVLLHLLDVPVIIVQSSSTFSSHMSENLSRSSLFQPWRPYCRSVLLVRIDYI